MHEISIKAIESGLLHVIILYIDNYINVLIFKQLLLSDLCFIH